MKTAIALVLALLTCSPAMAVDGSCWRDSAGRTLSFSDKDWTNVKMFAPGSQKPIGCERTVGDDGPQLECADAPIPVGMAKDKAGVYAVQYAGRFWSTVPCGPLINHEAF